MGLSMFSRSSGMSWCFVWLSSLVFLFVSFVVCCASWLSRVGMSESMLIGGLFVTSWLLFSMLSFGLTCVVVAVMWICSSTGVDWWMILSTLLFTRSGVFVFFVAGIVIKAVGSFEV